ncbi:MAG: response regulator [Candidatus Cloacimonadota bacterium]|nr:response regulator [Candidatus Cloacimonadota bacterium]
MNKILIVDDSRSVRLKLKYDLENIGYEIIEASSGVEAIKQLQRTDDIDLMILDVEMPGLNGFETIEKIKSNKNLVNYQYIPVVFITGHDSFKDRLKGFNNGSVDFIHKPFGSDILKKVVSDKLENISNNDDSKRLKILIVEDSKANRLLMQSIVSSMGIEAVTATDGNLALEILEEQDDIDLVVTDIFMKEMDGDILIQEIKKNEKLKHIPIIVLTILAEHSMMLDLFKLGAADYLIKPFVKEEFIARINVQLDNVRKSEELNNSIKKLNKVNFDIIEKQKAMIQLEKQNSVLAMAVTANHEINQPLTIIQMNLDIILMKTDLTSSEEKRLSKIQDATNRIGDILKKYRDNKDFFVEDYLKKDDMISFDEES